MNTIEEFFKNRISFNYKLMDAIEIMFGGERYMYYLNSNTIYNPESLNISNTIDLIEKLKPLFFIYGFVRWKIINPYLIVTFV